MTKHSVLPVLLGAVMLIAATAHFATPPPASAATACPTVEVVFARGTVEPLPPLGLTGESFAAALRARLPGKSVVAYGVNYPASDRFANRAQFVQTVLNGINDAQNRIKYLARACPRTRVVLGGYSQGAVVAGYAANSGITIPARYREYQSLVPRPLPAEVSQHVAALVLFAPPSNRFIRDIGAPPIVIAPQFLKHTVRYCIPGDTICNGAPVGQPNALHVLYAVNGNTVDAAQFVAGQL